MNNRTPDLAATKPHGPLGQEHASALPRADQRLRALVVDDEPLVVQFLADTLEDMGFEVVQAGTVAGALSAASSPGPFAVAFIDLGLPDRSGLELIAELQKLRPRLPILISTGYGSMAQRDGELDSTLPKILAKPYNAKTIASALAEFDLPGWSAPSGG